MPRPTIGQEPWGATLNADLNQIEANANSRIAESEKGSTNGVAPLDSSGRLPEPHVPARLSAAVLNSTYYRRDEGVSGPAGQDGATWILGTGAPSGATGVLDDLYLDNSNGDYYKKTDVSTWTLQGNLQGADGAAGADGADGTDGTDGTDGANGATWLSGAGAPASGSGVVNDFYINTSNGDYYKKTDSTTWTLQGNLKGTPATTIPANVQTGNYTIVLTDAGGVVEMNSASTTTVTVPTNSTTAFPVGSVLYVHQYGAGQVTIAPAGGVTISTPASYTTRARYSTVMLRKRASDEWILSGDLT